MDISTQGFKVKNKKINFELKIGFFVLSLYALWAIFWQFTSRILNGTFSEPHLPHFEIKDELLGFGEKYLLGTDIYGRPLFDVLSEGLIYSLSTALTVSIISASIGIVFGYLAANENRWIKLVFDFIINSVFIFPSILIAILVMSIIGQSYWGLIFALSLTNWPGYAKIARGESLRLIKMEFAESARAIGVGDVRLFLSVIFPNLLPVIMVHFVLGLSGVIISEASLGFLGLGGSEYSWGAMFSMSKTVLLEAPRLTIILSLCVGGLIIGLNLLGDGLRDYLDPHQK